MVKVNKTT